MGLGVGGVFNLMNFNTPPLGGIEKRTCVNLEALLLRSLPPLPAQTSLLVRRRAPCTSLLRGTESVRWPRR